METCDELSGEHALAICKACGFDQVGTPPARALEGACAAPGINLGIDVYKRQEVFLLFAISELFPFV